MEVRKPPFSEDAEVSLLSAVLVDGDMLLPVLEHVTPDCFYLESHRRIFRAMVYLAEVGSAIDPPLVKERLVEAGELEAIGGAEYLGYLVDAVPTAVNAPHYAKIVAKMAGRRRLLEAVMSAESILFDPAGDTATATAVLQEALSADSLARQRSGFVRVKDDLWASMEAIEARARGQHLEHVIATGYPEIDRAVGGGFQHGELIVLAGVPGGCKTAAVVNMGLNAALDKHVGVAVVSAEMTRQKLHDRNLANVGRVSYSNIRSGKVRDDEWPRLANAAGILSKARLWIDETPTPAIDDVLTKCRGLKKEHPEVGLIIVDFIQLVQRRLAASKGMREENRARELTEISYLLKAVAKELSVVVMATCQVDASAVEKRSDKRPLPGDARWSQGMREAADFWASCYRDKTYNPDPMAPDLLELIFQKGRDAEPFTVKLNWIGSHMLLDSPERRQAAQQRGAA